METTDIVVYTAMVISSMVWVFILQMFFHVPRLASMGSALLLGPLSVMFVIWVLATFNSGGGNKRE